MNTNILKSYLMKNGKTYKDLAKEMKISPTSLSKKLNKRSKITLDDIKEIQNLVGLSNEDRDAIFFA